MVYLIVSILTEDANTLVNETYPVIVCCNTFFIVVALYLYAYSICLVKKAINESSNYNFRYKKSYLMMTLYIALMALEALYLINFKIDEGSMVAIEMLRI